MFPNPYMHTLQTRQRGSGLVVALFIMVVMLALVLALGRVMQSSQGAIVYEVLGSKALMAAQSGGERALSQLFPLSASASCAAVDSDFSGASGSGLAGCSAVMSCSENSETQGGESYTLYRITSTGSCIGGDFSASRTISVEARE